jgi:hypothetical protein
MSDAEITVKATAKFRFATPDCTLYLHSHFTTAGATEPREHTLKVVCEGADRAETEEIMGRVVASLRAALGKETQA